MNDVCNPGINKAFLDSPVGVLEILEEKGFIRELHFGSSEKKPETSSPSSPVLKRCLGELREYFEGTRRVFTVPLHFRGTPFQEQVWRALLEIPYGETRSYQDIAVALGNPRALRAVGGANHKNPLALLVPCHRVIGKDGSLTGFGGGLSIKQWLLEHEKRHALKG